MSSARLREQVLGALATVYDPELDEPITELRFVTKCEVNAEISIRAATSA